MYARIIMQMGPANFIAYSVPCLLLSFILDKLMKSQNSLTWRVLLNCPHVFTNTCAELSVGMYIYLPLLQTKKNTLVSLQFIAGT